MTTTFVPTPDQQAVADQFFQFLMSDAPTFVLSGGAGVGKTTLMQYISNNVMQTYHDACTLMNIKPEYHEVSFTATTNKAAEVLEKTLNKPVSTVHSFLGVTVKEDKKSGKTFLEPTRQYRVRHNHILFIDESSMIDTQMYDFIMDAFKDSKIVFVGDHAQMSPVGEEISPVYLNVDKSNFAFLSKPVRNADQPALMDLCTQLRNTVEAGEFHPMVEVPGVIDYLGPEDMQTALEHYFKLPNPAVRILCYTNSRVQDYNAFIREVRGLPPEFTAGDELVVAQSYMSGKVSLNVEREILITEIEPDTYNARYAELTGDSKDLTYKKFHISPPGSLGVSSLTCDVVDDPAQLRCVLQALKRKKRWPEFFQLKNQFLDLRDKYACTVYKSQGSTYDTVFIDLGNIGTARDPEQVARMLFVGVSRATTRVFFYGNLPAKYQGKVAA